MPQTEKKIDKKDKKFFFYRKDFLQLDDTRREYEKSIDKKMEKDVSMRKKKNKTKRWEVVLGTSVNCWFHFKAWLLGLFIRHVMQKNYFFTTRQLSFFVFEYTIKKLRINWN